MTRFIENPPTGETTALACRHASEESENMEAVPVSVPHYPQTEQGEHLRAWRRQHNLSIMDQAEILGWRPVQVGDLHRGKVSVHPDDWPGVLARLAAWEAR